MEFATGSTIRFDYPAANYLGIRRPRFDQRRLKVERVRELAKQPLEPTTIQEEPLLRRGSVLVTGWDLDKHQERSFYLESMQNIEPYQSLMDLECKVQLLERDSDPETVWEGDGESAIAYARQWLQEPLGLTVAIVPIGQSRQEAA
jgi:hypothetical protein